MIMVSKNYRDRYEVLTNRMLEEARDKQKWKRAFSCQTAMSQKHCLHLPPQGFTQDCIYRGSQLLDAVLSKLFSSVASKIHRSPPCSTQTSTTTTKTFNTNLHSRHPSHPPFPSTAVTVALELPSKWQTYKTEAVKS